MKNQEKLPRRGTIVTSTQYDEIPTSVPESITTSHTDKNSNATPTESIRCDPEARSSRKFTSCNSLHQSITNHFRKGRRRPRRLDTSYNVFTLVDMFYSGLLESENSLTEAGKAYLGAADCEALLKEWVRPRNVESGPCSWHYRCNYDPSRFPGFKVEAVINNQHNLDSGLCRKDKMKFVTVFEKTICEEDPCRMAEHWIERNNQEIIVGFKEAA